MKAMLCILMSVMTVMLATGCGGHSGSRGDHELRPGKVVSPVDDAVSRCLTEFYESTGSFSDRVQSLTRSALRCGASRSDVASWLTGVHK